MKKTFDFQTMIRKQLANKKWREVDKLVQLGKGLQIRRI